MAHRFGRRPVYPCCLAQARGVDEHTIAEVVNVSSSSGAEKKLVSSSKSGVVTTTMFGRIRALKT